ISWPVVQDPLGLTGWKLLAAFVALYGGFTVATQLISKRSRALFGGAGAAFGAAPAGVKGRAGGSALMGAFLAHIVLVIAFVAASVRLDNPAIAEMLPSTFFVLQGVAWIVIHAMRRATWHMVEAWAWFAAAIGAALLTGTAAFAPAVA